MPAPFRKLRAWLTRQPLDNQAFWNERYASNPQLGSGLGSRGDSLALKRELLTRLVEEVRPATVLDVGCGDLQVGSVLPSSGYLGVDVAEVVVEANRRAFPERTFVAGDFLTLSLAPADLVVALDVLIHQSEPQQYQDFVGRLVQLTGGRGAVAGYHRRPRAWRSHFTFYHEPLADTLARAGAREIRELGRYQRVTLYTYSV